jgi:hypothetical protein
MFKLSSIGSRHAMRLRRMPLALSAAALLTVPSLWSPGAKADAVPQAPSANEPAASERNLNAFISSAIVRYSDQSFARWPLGTPVCLQVYGIEPAERDLVIARIYSDAQAAGVRTGGAKCIPTLLVFVTAQADATIAALRQREPRMFSTHFGVERVERFMHTPRPVRAWYNIYIGGGVPNSKIQQDQTRVMSQVFVFVDTTRLGEGVNFQQLADYVAMVGLAEINPDANLGDAPTILNLFGANAGARSPGLTSWDQAILHSLYLMPRQDIQQVDEMTNYAVQYLRQSP